MQKNIVEFVDYKSGEIRKIDGTQKKSRDKKKKRGSKMNYVYNKCSHNLCQWPKNRNFFLKFHILNYLNLLYIFQIQRLKIYRYLKLIFHHYKLRV